MPTNFGPQLGTGLYGGGKPVFQFGNDVDPAAAALAAEKKKAEQFARNQWQGIKAHTYGRANALQNDPVQEQIRKFLGGVINGQNTPYSESVLNALQGQQAHGAATAQAAQMEALRQGLGASGGSIYDPGYQAAQRESDATRQGQNMDYAGQLRAQAALENFNASSNAAKSLGALNQGQNAQINQLGLAGAGFQAQRHQQVATPGVLMPQYNPMMQQGGGAGDDKKKPGLDNNLVPPDPTAGNFKADGFGYGPGFFKSNQSQTPQTPENNSNLAGPPVPQPYSAAAGYANPNRATAPQGNAVGGTILPQNQAQDVLSWLAQQRGGLSQYIQRP